MKTESATRPRHGVARWRNVHAQSTNTSAPPSRPNSLSVDARSPVAEMEGILRTTTDYSRYMDALSTLRCCSLDTMQGSAFREKAKALVWKYQANGWDEV